MLVTPETNTAVSGLEGSPSGATRETIAEGWVGSVLNAPLAGRGGGRKRRI
jgi:hypothetical protein